MAYHTPHIEKLAMGIRNLTTHQKQIRSAFGGYLKGLRRSTAAICVARFRGLAQCLRFGAPQWHKAIDRLFSRGQPEAEKTVSRYRRWLAGQDWNDETKCRLSAKGLVQVSHFLKSRSIIGWQLDSATVRHRENRWASCSREFRDLAEVFLREREVQNLSKARLSGMWHELVSLGSYLNSNNLGFDRLAYNDVLTWLEQLRKSGLGSSSINGRLYSAKGFYGWLRARKLIEDSPFAVFRSVREHRKLPRLLTEEEVLRLIRAARDCRERAIIEVLYASGCRVHELVRLDLHSLSLSERTARTIGKGGHERIIYLNGSAIDAIKAYLRWRTPIVKKYSCQNEPGLFVTLFGTRIATGSVRNLVAEVGVRAEFELRIHPHILRHSFATHLLNRGADLFSIMQFLGHKNIQSTVKYLQVATARLSEVHRKYHPRR